MGPWLLRTLLLIAIAGGGSPAHAQTAPDAHALATTVRNEAAPRDARLAAAARLLSADEAPEARRELEHLLAPDEPGLPLTLEALARHPSVIAELLPSLDRIAQRSSDAALPAVLRAVSSVRTRDAAVLLFRYANGDRPAPIRACAFESLARLSGHTEWGTDQDRWRAWVRDAAGLSDAQWRTELIAGLAHRADDLSADVRAASGRVVDGLRRLYLATPPSERSGLLTAMLQDESTDVRTLAFELALRELSSSRRLDDTVGEAALRLLTDKEPAIRASAAGLVNRLNPPTAESRVLESLARETDPVPASAMILAATRWPSPAVIDAVFRWLDTPGPVSGAAADALWSLLRTGVLSRDADQTRLLRSLRATPDDNLNLSSCLILGAIGQPEDVARLRRLLSSTSPTIRVAAAKALVNYPEAADDILAAASRDAQLLDLATQSVMMHRATAAGFHAVEALPALSPEAHRRAMLAVAPLLPATDLLDVAREAQSDMALRESYLTLLASPDRILSERADPAKLDAIAEGVILLARTRLALDRPDAAVAALDALPELSTLVDRTRIARLRALAMICLNRFDDALALSPPPSVWLDALERCINKPFAPALADTIDNEFSTTLTADERSRLDRLRELLPPAPPPTADTEFVGPLQPVR